MVVNKLMKRDNKLLMLVPYGIEAMNNAPRVRAYNMYNALKKEIPTILIHGSKWKRLSLELKYILKNEPVSLVYIEAMASDLTLFDHLFLNYLLKRQAMLFPFIRDLYWRYPGTLDEHKPKRGISVLLRLLRSQLHLFDEKELSYYLRNATALLFPSSIMADTVNFPEKFLLPPAGDASRCLNPELPENKNIVYLGAATTRMGIYILMKAMAIVAEEYPDAHCIVIGQADRTIVDEWKDKTYVTFITDKTYKEIPIILSRAYVAVIPLAKIPYNELAVPVKLLDYMSCGRPVVATNCIAMTNFIKENNAGLITDDNPASFAKGILTLLDDRELATKYGKGALSAVVNKHSWDHRARELIDIMEKCSKKGSNSV